MFFGRFAEGCKSNCNGRGKCVSVDDEGYECDCQDGWAGADCSIRIESDCDDKIDNDGGKTNVTRKSEISIFMNKLKS